MSKLNPTVNQQFIILSVLLFAITTIVLSLFKGSTSIPIKQLLFNSHEFQHILLDLRLPRTMNAFICGGLLAMSGMLMQLLLENPLADPYALGVSGGAALVILLLMLIGLSPSWWLLGAWSGSLLTMALISLLARRHRWQPTSLLLIGIALACCFSAAITIILLLSSASDFRSMIFFLSGDLTETNYPWASGILLLLGLYICHRFSPGMDILTHGQLEAQALGLASRQLRRILFLLSSLFTAAAVIQAGCIGFIGMLVPHIARKLLGNHHRITIPFAMLLGGSLVTLADTLARSLFSPNELPIGVILALIGAPIFIALLQK